METAAEVRGATAEVGCLYGGEFWGATARGEAQIKVDKAQASVARQILHIRATAEAEGALTELGWTATSVTAWTQRMLFWWRLGRSKSALLQKLEWQSAQPDETHPTDEDAVSEYDWWRVTRREVAHLMERTKMSDVKLRALPRDEFRRLIANAAFRMEYSARRATMLDRARLKNYADIIETKKLRNPEMCARHGWKALRAEYVTHISSAYHGRMLAMARLGLLAVEEETGRWKGVAKEERFCAHCPNVLGSTKHFLRECRKLQNDPVPLWGEAPEIKNPTAGPWWRLVARKLEKRWREKCAVDAKVTIDEATLRALIEEVGDIDDELNAELTDVSRLRDKPAFLDPGSEPPADLHAEIFTDGSGKSDGTSKDAGWGVWGVIFDAATGDVENIVTACGPVVTVENSDEYIGAEKKTNMTGELCGIYFALQEIAQMPRGAKVLLRFDCIPAVMIAAGIFKPKTNRELARRVQELWRRVTVDAGVVLIGMHAKGHSKIYGNTKADAMADRGREASQASVLYRTVAEFGGALRFAGTYYPGAGDCGKDSELERKYAGKRRARKKRNLRAHENGEMRAIQRHLRQLGITGERAAEIVATIKEGQ
jgi:ribonuclease HI